jgi:CelD/BcsL family acetyltransferase involved in cellulose biosynthesis
VTPAALERLSPEWDALADRLGAVPFLRPGWVAAWWEAFGQGVLEPQTIRTDGRLTALVALYRPAWRAPAFKTEPFPLTARRRTLRATVNWHTPKAGFVAEDASAAGALARALVSRGEQLVSLAFFGPSETGLLEFRTAAESAGYRLLLSTLPPSPYVDVVGEWREYQAGLDGDLLRDLRRRRRRLEDQGDVTFEVADGRERLEALLAEGLTVETSGWKAARGSAISSRDETTRFYTEAARWAAERGWLRLSFLRIDGRAVAFQYGIEDGGVYYFLKGGYDPAFHRFAPGKLLVQAMLNRAFDGGLARFDFLGGDEPWKLEWTATCRERVIVHAFAPSLAGSLERVAITYGRPIRARARRRLRDLRARARARRR